MLPSRIFTGNTRMLTQLLKRSPVKRVLCTQQFSKSSQPIVNRLSLLTRPAINPIQSIKPVREFHQSLFHSMTTKTEAKESHLTILCRYLGITTTATLVLATAWFLKEYGLRENEVPIMGDYIDLTKHEHLVCIVNADKFTKVGDKPKGHLSGSVVLNNESKTSYVQKGAQSPHALLYEFVISHFLSKLRPHEQPQALILQEKQKKGNARYYTLSEILPETMDLEDFVTRCNWKEVLSTGKLVGFEEALASVLMFANSDIKLANLLVTRKTDMNGGTIYVVTAIDHELSGNGICSKPIFLFDSLKMIDSIRDFQPYHEDWNPVAHAGSPVVMEFRQYIINNNILVENKLIDFYKNVADVSLEDINQLLQAIGGETGFVSKSECEKLKQMIENVKTGARELLENNNLYQEVQVPRLGK